MGKGYHYYSNRTSCALFCSMCTVYMYRALHPDPVKQPVNSFLGQQKPAGSHAWHHLAFNHRLYAKLLA
jgi:hypothetical protein